MSHRTLIVDGLWYSLCPSFSSALFPRHIISLRLRPRSSRQHLVQPIRCTAALSQRVHNSTARNEHHEGNGSSMLPNCHDGPSPATDTHISIGNKSENQRVSGHSPRRTNERSKRFRMTTTPEHLKCKSVEWLENNLQYRVVKNPTIRGATEILRALIRDHGVQPQGRHYKALILAHSDHERGSAYTVGCLLQEMEEHGITADSGTLHAVLQVSTSLY